MNIEEALKLIPKRLFTPIEGKWINLDCEPLGKYIKYRYYYEQMGYAITTYIGRNICLDGHFHCWGISLSNEKEYSFGLNSCEKYDFCIQVPLEKIAPKNEEENIYVIEFPLEVKVNSTKRKQCKKEGCKDYNSCKLLEMLENDSRAFCVQLVYKLELEKEESKKQATISDFINMDIEFGQVEDNNLVSTIMGIAVRNDNAWNILDAEKNEITDVNIVKNKNIFPIYSIPVTNVRKGDLITENGEYYYVTEVHEYNLITVNAKTGEMKVVKPLRNVRGKEYFVKLTSFMDFIEYMENPNIMKLIMFYLLKDKMPDSNS